MTSRKIKKIILVLFLLILSSCIDQPSKTPATIPQKTQYKMNQYQGEYGSAGFIKDHTLIVSIYANDKNTQWNFDDPAHQQVKKQTLSYLSLATKWIKKQVKPYHISPEFIYDWQKYNDLSLTTTFNEDMVVDNISMYSLQKQCIKQLVDSHTLQKKNQAENIIYMFFFNTDKTNPINPWSLSHSNGTDFNTEIINIFVCFDDVLTPPASYAHEILHCFGAPDLYYENAYITQAYVDHCQEICSNDIMYGVSFGEEMIDELSELDAYYLGLKDHCHEVEQWHLHPSDYQKEDK